MRLQVTLENAVFADLTYLADRLRVSRSALLSTMVGPALRDLRALMESIPPEPTPEDVRRLRGRSVDLIAEEMRHYMSMLSEGGGNG